MTKASDNPYPSLLIVEGSTPASPAAGNQRVFIDSADNTPKCVDSTGAVTTIGGTSSTRVNTTTAQSFTSGVWRAVTWENEDFDDLACHSTVTNTARFTVPATGRYKLETGVGMTSCYAFALAVRKNGATPPICQQLLQVTADGELDYTMTTGTLQLTAGDYLEVWAIIFKTAGSGSTTLDTANIPVWASVDRLA